MLKFNDRDESGRVPEENLLFAVTGRTATEVAHRGLVFDNSIEPLFEETKVTRPVPVMVEGEYAVLSRAQGKYQKIKISAEDIETYAQNTPRDVAVNYEHVRGGRAKGWVRLKDTARIGTLETREGPKTALFASLELYEAAAEDVRKGYFRDVSIELKPVSKEIIGTALTSSPVMRDLQFYSNGVLDEGPAAGEPVEEPSDDSDAAADPVEASHPSDNPSSDTHFSEEDNVKDNPSEGTPAEDRQTVLAEALQEFGLTPEDLKALPQLIQRAEFAERQGRINEARNRVTELVTNDEGKTVLTKSGIDAAAQLMVFAQDNAEEDLVFSVDGVTDEEGNARELDLDQLFAQLFESIEAVQIFGETSGVPADQIDPPAPADGAGDEPQYDEERVNRIANRIKNQFRSQ